MKPSQLVDFRTARADTFTRTAEEAGVIIDLRSGERGSVADWVTVFAQVWGKPQDRLDRLLALLGDTVTLKAPTIPPVSRGKEAARAAFERAFHGLPDLCAEVSRWSASGDVLFIEMTFQATVGGHRVSWDSVDRFVFRDGVAIERVAYFDPSRLRKAFLWNLGAFRQFRRLRKGLGHHGIGHS